MRIWELRFVLLLENELHILKEIKYDWCGSEKRRGGCMDSDIRTIYRRQLPFLNLFSTKI